MAHPAGAIALLFLLLLPTTAAAQAERSDPGEAAAGGGESMPFDRWVDGPVRYLLSEREKQIGEALPEPGDFAAFRHWFWQRRDPTPGTIANEFRDEFESRVAYANKEFASPSTGTKGWRTSKGVVYIVLGPPTRIRADVTQVYGHVGGSLVETWVYEFRKAALLEVSFVEDDGGFALLTTPANRPMQARLEQALRRAAEASVFDSELPFTGVDPSPTAVRVLDTWPGEASASCSDSGIDAEVSIPLTLLYGHPEGSGLRVDLRLEAESGAGGERVVLGDVSVLLRPSTLASWHDRPLTVALWFPAEGCVDATPTIEVIEIASGRRLRFAADGDFEAMEHTYRVEELLSSIPLMTVNGAAIAFIRGDDASGTAPAGLVLRHAEGLVGPAAGRPQPALWLAQDGGG
jgi:GWxTD domain-containing protein